MPLASCLASRLQYNITVVGVSKTGARTPGANMLQFQMPKPAVPPPGLPGLQLVSARAISPVRGVAVANPSPSATFTQVRGWEEGLGVAAS